MLAVNQCPEAFWIGNLKNRDLQGHEIMSQQSLKSKGEEGSSEGSGDECGDDSRIEEEKVTNNILFYKIK